MNPLKESSCASLSKTQARQINGGVLALSSLINPKDWVEAFETVNEKWDEWKAEVASGWNSCGCSY